MDSILATTFVWMALGEAVIESEWGEFLPPDTIIELRKAYYDHRDKEGCAVLTKDRAMPLFSRLNELRRVLGTGAAIKIPLLGRIYLNGK